MSAGCRCRLGGANLRHTFVDPGMSLPGTHIPVHAPGHLAATHLLRDGISQMLDYVRTGDGRLATLSPELKSSESRSG
jgi:hypothetical protein